MPAPTSETLLADLRRLQLLSPEQLARVQSASARRTIPGPETIVKRLIDKGWITPFQAEVLLAGKSNGLVFGHYVLLSRLGEGGMGAVFKARHTRLDRIDALKVIRADKIASKLVAKRFLREIQLTADLNHPHIIKALDAGQVGSQLYLATEYVPGEDLTASVRREGTLSVADACLVTYQTALALRHIHERNLIHRDLKPSNIMREEKTRSVKLLDLGLSNSLHGTTTSDSQAGNLTRDGVMLGTPDFMPPEQARNPHGVDIRADLYSLGCTLFYLLTGRTPYEGSAVEKLLQHTTAPIPPLILPRNPTPAPLAGILTKLMAKRPEERYQTPSELIDALLALRPANPVAVVTSGLETKTGAAVETVDQWQSDFDLLIANDLSASGVHAIHREPKPASKRQSGGLWWIVAGMLLFATATGLLIARGRTNIEPEAAETPPASEEPVDELKQLRAAVQNPAENRDQLRSRVLAFRSKSLATPAGIAAAGLLRKLPSPLDRLAPVKDPATGSPIVRLIQSGDGVSSMSFSPTDDKLFVVREGELPEEWDLPVSRLAERSSGSGVAATEGKLLVRTENGVKSLFLESNLKPEQVTLLPDGKSAVVSLVDSDERLVRVSLDTGKIAARLDHPSGGLSGLAVSPDGGACLVFGPEAMIRMLSLSSGKLLQAFDTPTNVSSDPAGCFSPDGQRLYLIGAFRTAGRFAPGSAIPSVVYEVPQERPNPFLSRFGNQGRPLCIAVSADETVVAVGTRSGLHLYAASTGKATQEFRFTSPVISLAFSTHGRVLAVALDDGSVLLLPLKS